MEVNRREYEFNHGAAPRGRGYWMFDVLVAGSGRRFLGGFNGTFGEASRAAKKAAKAEHGSAAMELFVLP